MADTSAPDALEVRFGPLAIRYGPESFAPRPWTENQARWAAEEAVGLPAGSILELGAGVGHIGILTAVLTGRRLVQADSDAGALAWARRNAAAAGLSDRAETRLAAAEEAAGPAERFPLILADPPYVPSAEVEREPGPVPAVDGGPDGLGPARRWVAFAARHLTTGGMVSLQIGGRHQAETLLDWITSNGVGLVATGVRVFGPDRAVVHLRGLESAGPTRGCHQDADTRGAEEDR